MPQTRHIIHGGAGAITPRNLPPPLYHQHASFLLHLSRIVGEMLNNGKSAFEAATEAVRQMEDCDLWNCGKGAIFTRDGNIELEASVMVSSPTSYPKRTCAVSLLQHTKNPILLAKTMLERSQNDLHGSRSGAQGHSHLSGPIAESMAQGWGLEMVPEEYFWTRKRWDEHIKGLKKNKEAESSDGTKTAKNADSQGWEEKIKGGRVVEGVEAQEGWDGESYLPQGTVGCVCLDREGTLCVATSTGGLTNKLDGRIGDTPTAGAGYWANEWTDAPRSITPKRTWWGGYPIVDEVNQLIINCLPSLSQIHEELYPDHEKLPSSHIRAVAMSGTGNGDSFLRLSACRTAASIAQYSPHRSLASAVKQVAGPGGELQRSAMNRWGRTGEGEGGIVGIELIEGEGKVVWDFNCGGMFRCWVDDAGRDRIMVFRDEYRGLE